MIRGKPGTEMLYAVYLLDLYCTSLYPGLRGKDRVNFIKLYTKPTELDLVVPSAKDLHITFFCPSCEITGLIYPYALIFHEFFCSHLRKVIIACRNAYPAYIKLSGHIAGNLVPVAVNYELDHPGKRASGIYRVIA